LVEGALAGVYVIQQGYFRYVNPKFATMFGYAVPDEIINRVPVADLVAAHDRARVCENVRQRAEGLVKEMRYRFTALRRDGSTMHVEVHGSTGDYAGAPAVIGTLVDVSEQVRLEARLRVRESKIEALFNGNIIGMLCWDGQGRIRDANQAFFDMLGLTRAALGPDGLAWQHITPDHYLEACRAHIDEILRTGRGTAMQKEFRHRDGHLVPALVNGVRVDDAEAGGISFVLNLSGMRDVEKERHMLATIIDQAPVIMFVQDAEGRFIYVNKAGRLRPSGEEIDLVGKDEFFLMSPESAQRVAADRARILASGGVHQFEEAVTFNGATDPIHFRTTKWPMQDAGGRTIGLAGVVVEITEQKKTEAELATLGNLVSSVFEYMPMLAMLKDVSGRIISCNRMFCSVHGVTPEQAVGRQLWEVVPQLSEEAVRLGDEYVLQTGKPYVKEGLLRIGGQDMPFLLNLFPVRDVHGSICALCGLVQNLSDAKRAQAERVAREKAEFESLHDSLTGLPNRRQLLERLTRIRHEAQQEGRRFIVCFIDLDRFKEINDILGHAAGDELLQVLARRMSCCIRDSDVLARIGGDEFVAVLCDDPDALELQRVIERFESVVSERVVLKRADIRISCSIGHAVYPHDGTEIDELLAHSDAHMYRRKESSRSLSLIEIPDPKD
ncbi:MAG TPA: PAS domain S-box protein, partial [Rhodocyclaceae bacterium]|nr:PAS domain S-box protein [Rhodocyclaceae bacterium]